MTVPGPFSTPSAAFLTLFLATCFLGYSTFVGLIWRGVKDIAGLAAVGWFAFILGGGAVSILEGALAARGVGLPMTVALVIAIAVAAPFFAFGYKVLYPWLRRRRGYDA